MKAVILGIGTELVDGQIVNKNAAWISEKLKQRGLTTALHLVVPDDRSVILEALNFCAKYGDLVFVTGGLGPTSDDFTREVISQWTNKNLTFNDDAWKHIKDRLEPRGYVVKEIQKQQCYFPEGAKILKNNEGTAHGFFINTDTHKLFILPGPPREIEAIWNLSINDWLAQNTDSLDPYITRHWDTMGMGESDVATLVEEALQGIDIEKGYRVHLPYVEVKVSFHKSQSAQMNPYVDKLTDVLKHITITRDQEDVPQKLAQALKTIKSLSIQDSVTGQFLMNRLMPVLRSHMQEKNWNYSNQAVDEDADVKLLINKKDENTCIVGVEKGIHSYIDIVESPYKSALMKERRAQYFAELAMIFWLKHL